MINVEQLFLNKPALINDLNEAVSKLTRLNYIYFGEASFEIILPFVKSLPKLQKIKMITIENGPHFNNETKILDLSTLNYEREHLKRAKKLTIYLTEMIYLATRWAFNLTEFALIEIKRSTSIDEFDVFY